MYYTIANSDMVNEKEAQLYTCQSCEKKYIVRKCEAQYFAKGNDRHYCVPCRKAFRAKLEREREEQEDLIWQRKKAEDQKLFESLLPTWNLKDLSVPLPVIVSVLTSSIVSIVQVTTADSTPPSDPSHFSPFCAA